MAQFVVTYDLLISFGYAVMASEVIFREEEAYLTKVMYHR